jgi:hypothetical protein
MNFTQTLIITIVSGIVSGLFSLGAALIVAFGSPSRGWPNAKKPKSPGMTDAPSQQDVRARWLGVRNFTGVVALVAFVAAAVMIMQFVRPGFPGRAPLGPSSPGGQTALIHITNIPTYDAGGGPNSSGHIAGKVSGVNPSDYRVVIYAHTNLWYVQPYVAEPITGITITGDWSNETHLGSDYAALLVKPGYKPLSVTEMLPPLGGEVAASTVVKGLGRNEGR